MSQNQTSGVSREDAERAELEQKYPDASVQGQRYLRDVNGKILKDPITMKGRRIDFAVIKDGKVEKLEEVTSLTEDKKSQIAQENRIRNNGGTYIRDAKTKKLIDVSNLPTQVIRRQ